MAGILCVWAFLPDESIAWYENEFIPQMRTRNAIHTLHCELTESGFGAEPIGKLDSPWPLCAVYDVEEIRKATQACYDKANHPPDALLAGPLANARFDTRTYRELKRWQADDWDGDILQIASVVAMEWRVSKDMQDEVFDYYTSFVGPKLASSEDVLRLRVFEVDNATVLQGESYETKERESLHTYFTLVELESEEWPWDVIIELDANENWHKYFEAQKVVNWQMSTYLVKRAYQDEEKYDSLLKSDTSTQNSDGGTPSDTL